MGDKKRCRKLPLFVFRVRQFFHVYMRMKCKSSCLIDIRIHQHATHAQLSTFGYFAYIFFFLSYLHKRHNVKVKVFLRWQWPKKSIKSKAKIPPQKRIKFFMEKRANSRNSITMMFWCSIDFPNCVSHPNIVFLHTNNNLLNVGGESRRVWMFHQWNEEESGKKTFWRSNSNLIVKFLYCQTLGALPWVMRNSIAFFKKFKGCQKFQQSFRKLWVIPTQRTFRETLWDFVNEKGYVLWITFMDSDGSWLPKERCRCLSIETSASLSPETLKFALKLVDVISFMKTSPH